MLQQVNLYEPILRDDQKVFSATAICVGLGAVAVALVAISAFSEWRTRSLDRQLLGLHAQETTQKRFVAQANAIVDLAESHDTIEQHLKAMALDLSRRQQALHYLSGAALMGTSDGVPAHRGFVGRMTALARQQIDGLWLTGATFVSGSGALELSGSAVRADLVPIYLQRLAGEPAIAGTKLRSIDIRQPKKPIGTQIEFTVSTATLDEAKAGLSADAKDNLSDVAAAGSSR
jgi:hypothetical protein